MTLTARTVRLRYPDTFPSCWQPRLPEFCCLANAVSLIMPYAEPFVVHAVQAVLDELPEPLDGRARDYARQEAQHHAQHRRLNTVLARRYWGARALDPIISWTFRLLGRSVATRFATGFAAGFEAIAFAMARWIDSRIDTFFAGADPTATALYLWHLGEEAEHKGVAWDVHRARGGGRLSYLIGLVAALTILGLFTFAGTVVLLAGERRVLRPRVWVRLVAWLSSFAWEGGALLLSSLSPRHHPDGWRDPPNLTAWLADFSPPPDPTCQISATVRP